MNERTGMIIDESFKIRILKQLITRISLKKEQSVT